METMTAEAPSLTTDYTQELLQTLPQDRTLPNVQNLVEGIGQLAEDMESFEEAETSAGAAPHVWDAYDEQHPATVEVTQQAAEAITHDDGEADIVQKATDQIDAHAAFFRQQRDELLRREEEHQKEITALREELQKLKTLSQQSSPQALAECLAVAATFLSEVQATRDAAKDQPRVVAGELFANTRRAVHDTYQSIRFAPSRIKHYLMQKRNHAVDRVLQNVAHVIDQRAKSLVERRDTILHSSPLAIEHEERQAAAKYLTIIDEEIQKNGGKRNFLCEKHAAAALAQAGIRESIIEKTLLAHSTEPKMKTGLAKELASEAVNEGKTKAVEAKEAAR